MSSTVDVKTLPAGTRVQSSSGLWTAGDPSDLTRWQHEGGERTAANALIQRWLEEGRAEVLS